MRYQYAGPGPDWSGEEILRPGDVRELGEAPDGPWEPLGAPPEPAPPLITETTWTAVVPPATPEGM